MSKKGWDLTSTHSLEGGAEWLRKQSGALLVLVVRSEDSVFAVDAKVAPKDGVEMVELVMPGAMARLLEQRLEKRARAKVKQLGAM